jgi:hypothetical protein
VHHSDAARPQAPHTVSQFIMDVTCGHHGYFSFPLAMPKPSPNPALALNQFFVSTVTHSKCLLAYKSND